MKKTLIWLAALLLAASCVPALAADYTLEEKFVNQLLQNAYRASVTFTAEGDGGAALGEDVWAALKAILPRLSLSGDYSVQRGAGQITADLTVDGESAGKTVVLLEEGKLAFSSGLLGAESWFSAPADWDAAGLVSAVRPGPSAVRLLYAVYSAEDGWKQRAQPYLDSLRTDLEIWLNGYAAFASGEEDGIAYTELSCAAPAEALKEEMKALIEKVWQNGALLALLREIAGPEEQAYLQPGAGSVLMEAVDKLPLEGEARLVRRYDALGRPLLDEITLPLTGDIREITFTVRNAETAPQWAVSVTGENMEASLSCVQMGENAYEGEARLSLPEGPEELTFRFSLNWEKSDEQYVLSTDRFEESFRAELTVTDAEGLTLPDQTVALELLLYSRSPKEAPTRLNGSLSWRLLDGSASVSAALESRTAAPFDVARMGDLENPLPLETLSKEELAGLAAQWKTGAEAWLAGLAARLLTAE